MSGTEVMKASVPLNAAQSDSTNVTVGGVALVKPVNSATPLRIKNSIVPSTGTISAPSNDNVQKGKMQSKSREEFYKDLVHFHEKRGTPCTYIPKISGKVVDLHMLYNEVTERGGFAKVNSRDEWDEVLPELGLQDKCVNASAAIKHFYRRFLDKYERLNFFGEDPDKIDAADVSDTNDGGRSRRFFPSTLGGTGAANNAVPMSYNYRQHIVNMDRRRMYKLSMDLHKPSPYEKLMLSLLSPLPNEQDFAINVCTLMANESKHTLKINEYPKLLDVLLAHAGIFSEHSLREVFQYVYKEVRHHSLLAFWNELLYDKPHILQLCDSDAAARDSLSPINTEVEFTKQKSALEECLDMDFLNLGRGKGTQDYVGQRVQQILAILRNLSFFDENLQVFAKNRTFMRFIVMCTNIRWGSIHNQALDIAGNVATEMDLLDPSSDELSRSLLATLCDGIEGRDRAVIINCLEIMYKLCQRDSNEEHIFKCLNIKFYQTVCMYLSLNDIMLLIYTLEAIYALSSMGARFCHLIMQVRGIIDQLVSLVTVEAQSYAPDGCILMRVVETVPGNMLPMVAQNIANLQNVSAVQTKHIANVIPQQSHEQQQQQLPATTTVVDSQLHSVVPPQPNAAYSNGSPSHEDEQYALSWLGATFDKVSTVDSRVEQQELYRMYLSHCQKSGKHSVVTHTQFPRLVRLIFSNSVGPIAVKRPDGSELPGLYYVAIRLRAQPLPIQIKVNQTPAKSGDVKLGKSEIACSGRKTKLKRAKPQSEQQHVQINNTTTVVKPDSTDQANTPTTPAKTINQIQIQDTPTSASVSITISQTPKCVPTETTPTTAQQHIHTTGAPAEKTTASVDDNVRSVALTETLPITIQSTTFQSAGTVTTNTQPSSSLIKSLLANKVTQRQQKQKELVATAAAAAGAQPSPIKIASSTISAIVNNPLMQNTPLKVGQTTIKPLNTPTNVDKKPTDSAPPPLAPLSGGSSSSAVASDNNGRPVIIANQMLVDILDKKPADPAITANAAKRKLDETSIMSGRDTAKRLALETVKSNEAQVTPSKNAANLYAEMAASILEDEDLEDIPPPPPVTTTKKPQDQQQPSVVIPATIQATGVSLQNVQRQLLFQSAQASHLKLTQPSQHHLPTAMATIKTEQGLQTVPVLLQQKPIEQQQQQPQLIQQVIQGNVPVSLPAAQQPTQYVLATNPQGQTYLVAQQAQTPTAPSQPTQTVLVTQTPQQQSAGTKTIIILQQQSLSSQSSSQQQIASTSGGGQKMIMTTAQGQQVLVTQRQAGSITAQPQQFFINAQTGAATHIQHVPVSSVGPNIIPQRQLIQQSNICNPQPQSGQISPSLLSQLNHIPATIKLHNPNMQISGSTVQQHCQQQQQLTPATLSRLGKSVSIVQTTAATPLQIPQLQQHQSIIQQHIISGPSEKRQVIVGGRAIEIKDNTVITQTQQQPPPQQQQLNAQTVITTQATLPQQKITAQHQQQSTIQQKISVAISTQQAQVAKTCDPVPSLIQSCVKYIAPGQQGAQITIQSTQQATPTIIKKPQVAIYSKQQQQQQSNIPTQNAASSAMKTAVSSRPTTPVSCIVNNTEIAPTNSGGYHSQPQQDAFRPTTEGKEIKSSDLPYSAPIPKPTISSTPPPQPSIQPAIDPNWLFICDWRNCPRRKFKSIQDLHHHACMVHCPDHLENGAEIFCQWGVGAALCDGIPRKRFSLMTHILDRHLTIENLRTAAQRRIQTGANHIAQPNQSPVTIIRNIEATQRGNTASPALSTSSSGSLPSTGSSAIQAIKRHSADFVNPKELMDENEGPVTKSIRLTASLVLRNLVTYTTNAKRSLRRHESHLANVALSNVESSAAISHILFELNN